MQWIGWMFAVASAVAPTAPAPASVVAFGVGEVPAGWIAIEPRIGSEMPACTENSGNGWSVRERPDGRVGIVPRTPRPDEAVRVELADGVVTGRNHGEFGGSIEWTPHDRSAGFEIGHVNPVAATEYAGEVFIAEGLAHLGNRAGAILRLQRRDAHRWRIHRPFELNDAPVAAARSGRSDWIVVTHSAVLRIDLARRTQRNVYENLDWRWLSADSIRPLGRTWLLGVRHGAIRLVPLGDGYVEQWLVPIECRGDRDRPIAHGRG